MISNIELASGSPYTFAASSIITGLANYYLLNDAFFENSFIYGLYTMNVDGLKARTMNPMGITASEFFNNIQAGYKIGYQTYNPEFFNCGIYASADYKLDQFKIGTDHDDMQRHRAQRILVGATALVSLGSMDKPTRIIIEAGCRYSIGLSYKSPMSDDNSQLNNGLISHFAVKVASRGMLQDIGIFADINHFNLWKDYNPGQKLKNITLGFTWKITPQQADKRYRY
ncbi:MAG: hypothetical protein LUC88_05320 [Prevotella sp.]|nr:hypothetical protein [Prevotella sp.]